MAEAWESLYYEASRLMGGPIADRDLLLLNFPIVPFEIHVIYAVLAFAELVWAGRGGRAVLRPELVRAKLSRPPAPFRAIFKL